ncbi:MAG TPA: hypothetical protein VGK29_12395 [Paludibaculum sp.]|jgi:hypothetical protein
MEPRSSQAESGRESDSPAGAAYRWDVPGRSATIFIDYDLVDRLGIEIMRGFGALPKRGAEVGGILLGSAEMGDRMVVRIEDFVGVPCEYLRGPSYVLSEKDMQAFDEALERWRPAPDKRIYVVGYFRSNTRDVLQLSPEDLEILETRFPGSSAVCLQVKPYATRASEATFFLRENGQFPTGSRPAAFAFRRKEMGGGRPSRRPRGAETFGLDAAPETEPFSSSEAVAQPTPAFSTPTFGLPPAAIQPAPAGASLAPPARPRTGWFWIPLSFIFLLLGVVMGFQIALTYRNQQPLSTAADPYALDLSVVQFGESLHLKWNTEAAAFSTARRGVLHIQDGDNQKEVELKQEDLARGGALYRNSSSNVKFQLEVFPRDRNSVIESVELRLLDTRK